MTDTAVPVTLTRPSRLSPSSIATWEKCPQQFKYSRLDKLPEPPTEATLIGTIAHEVLEFLFKEEPGDRTQGKARQISLALWDEKYSVEVLELELDERQLHEFRWKTWWAIQALWQIEDPATVGLLPADLDVTHGLEASMQVDLAGVPVLGIIDRWQYEADGTIAIIDYKSGKQPSPRYEGEKKQQLTIYKMLVEATLPAEVSKTELYYLKTGTSWRYDPTPDDVARTGALLTRVWSEIAEGCATGTFETRKQTLCDWCTWKPICPAHRR